MAKKIRIGKTISMSWKILTNGTNAALDGRDLTLELKDPSGISKNLAFTVSNTNVLNFKYQGKDQTKVGNYTLTLWENKGKDEQTVIDNDAFILVCSSDKED